MEEIEFSAPNRFAILEHDWPTPHWDLFLEDAESLRSWRLLADPREHESLWAEPSAPHRKIYLDYEGPVSGDRGSVSAVDRGRFQCLADVEGRIEVRLEGRLFRRSFELRSAGGTLQFRWLD